MRKKITADRGSAITLAAILNQFKDSEHITINSLKEILKENGYVASIAQPMM